MSLLIRKNFTFFGYILVRQNTKKSNVKKEIFKNHFICVMLKYICTKKCIFQNIKKNTFKKINEMILNFYKICIIY
jgi:hypothetical protein